MTFPQTPLDIQVDLEIDGAWTEITSDVYRRDAIDIRRGRANEEGQIGPGACQLTLNNRSGKYSPRNPTGVYYGKIGRNTPIRVSVNHGDAYLNIADTVGDRGTTADHASLDITGDIDVRFEAILDDWYAADETHLMGKYSTSGRSWLFTILGGHLLFGWSSDGTGSTFQSEMCTEAVVLTGSRRLAVRATLDVDDGSGNHVVTFYTAPSISSGAWTQLGEANVDATTTSIFSGGGALDVGHVGDVFAHLAPVGQILAAEVRSGIGGSVVANPDWTAQAVGTTSFADGAGRTWTLAGNATIINRKTRFVGEVTSWPPRWDTSGQDVYTPIEAAGILRRLGQGDEAIQSAMRRELGNPALHGIVYYGGIPDDGIVAYWPCEDGSHSTVLASAHQGEPGMVITGTMNLAAYSGWPASDALPNLGTDSVATGQVPNYVAAGVAQARCFFYLPQAVGSETTLIDLVTTGTATTWTVRVDTSGGLILKAFDADVVNILTSSTLAAGITGSKVQIALELFQNGTATDWTLRCFDLDDGVVESTLTGSLASRNFGRITEIRVGATYGLSGAAFGHVALSRTETGFAYTSGALVGNAGEAASTRIARLADEEDLPVTLLNTGNDELVGPQKPAALLTLLRDAADVGQGLLYEARHISALQYRGLPTLYNQAAVELTYSTDLMPGLAPTDDDQLARNIVGVQRVDGAWGYATETEGPMSVSQPPDGMGRYPTSLTRNLYNDEQPAQHASWYVNLGTVDELRYPVVRVSVQAAPAIADEVMSLDCGNRLKILDPTTKLPPGDIDLLVSGYRETLAQFEWDFELNCQPASPYTVIVLDDDDLGRIDTDGLTLGAAATSTATTLVVHTTQTADGLVPAWTEDAGDYPMDLRLGGEVVTATAATPLVADTFTRTVAAGGWGTASDGVHTYTLTGGVSSTERSVASNRGLVTVSSSQTSHRQQTTSETCMDADVRCQMAVSATATGGSLAPCVLLRWASSTAHYRARLEFTTGGNVFVSVTVAGTIIGTNASTGLTYSPGDIFEVRVRIIGYRILMRVWPTGTTEPVVWHIDRTDVSSTYASGTVGLGAAGGTGNTNVGVEYRFDNFEVVTPQRMTVTRSVNGVVKAQAAGEDVRLATPTILAL